MTAIVTKCNRCRRRITLLGFQGEKIVGNDRRFVLCPACVGDPRQHPPVPTSSLPGNCLKTLEPDDVDEHADGDAEGEPWPPPVARNLFAGESHRRFRKVPDRRYERHPPKT